MRAFYSDHFVLPLPEGHKFPMAKYSRLRERILAEGIVAPDDLHEAPAASLGRSPARPRSPAMSMRSRTARSRRDIQRRIGFPWSPQMVERSRRSVGATIAAARAALDDGVSANLAGGTHHAFADRGEGFLRVQRRRRRRPRPAARSSTPAASRSSISTSTRATAPPRSSPATTSVFTFSMHGEKNFPFKKEVSDLDVALAGRHRRRRVPCSAAARISTTS